MLSILHNIVGIALSPLCVVSWLVCLLVNAKKIRHADVIILSCRPRAFGSVFMNLEFARRRYPNKAIVYLISRESNNHNPKLGLIFGDLVTLVSWPRPAIKFKMFGRNVHLPPRRVNDAIGRAMSRVWFRLFASSNLIVVNEDILEDDLPIDQQLLDSMPRDLDNISPRIDGYTTNGPYTQYFLNNDAPKLKLPDRWLVPIMARIKEIRDGAGATPVGLCGLYLKHDDTGDSFKDGSELEAYLPAIGLIVAAGYQVLVQGDRRLSEAEKQKFGGMVIDEADLRIDIDLYNLFVATECNIFVGDTGPGSWCAATCGNPQLVLNSWPYGLTYNTTWVFFKECRYNNGDLVPYETCFRDLPKYGAQVPGVTEITMTVDEITDAVRCFLQEMTPVKPPDALESSLISALPIWTDMRVCNVTRLSPAFLEKVKKQSKD